MTLLSIRAWQSSRSLITNIQHHPFNRELAMGSLNPDQFHFYLAQDSYYLLIFSRCLAMTAARAPVHLLPAFLDFSKNAFIGEQQLVHHTYQPCLKENNTPRITLATLAYTHYLLDVCANQPYPIAIAALLPCFWVYQEVGQTIIAQCSCLIGHPYERWITTYGSAEFADTVQRAIAMFDQIGDTASEDTQQAMLAAFYTSTALEWHSWNDAYKGQYYVDLPPLITSQTLAEFPSIAQKRS